MTSLDEIRLAQFKSSIGYAEAARRGAPNHGVVVDWPGPAQLPGLEKWDQTYEGISFHRDAASREWVLARGDEQLSLEIYVSSTGPEAAWSRLLEIATNTTMDAIPFRKAPVRLGDLAIVAGENDTLVWTFHNVCFRLEKVDSAVDLVVLARALQGPLDHRLIVTLSDHRPKLAAVKVSSPRIRVGQEVSVEVQAGPGQDPQRLVADFELAGEGLAATEQQKLVFRFAGEKPGLGVVRIFVVDRYNLLSTPATTTIEVVR